MNGKVRATHQRRRAIVYLRQSTTRQLLENVESTDRQYALAQRAEALGWPASAVDVIDDDLGQSGASTAWRPGFKRMAEQVTKGKVGAIFALEVSRFARSSADWHRLLELCRWTDVLIIDEHAIFDATDPNDGLLLGFKGQMSEAEKNWLKLRMHGARLNKARRGELKLFPPSGYQWDADAARLCFDPDAEVQQAIRFLFRRFRAEGSAMAAVRYYIRNDLRFPVRRPTTGVAEWVRPLPTTVTRILRNPIYTGAYVYGRTETRPIIADGQLRRTRPFQLPEEEWKVCIRDHHPAYISWEEYVDNRRILQENGSRWAVKGAPRNGAALLQGLAICGKCGARMSVGYGPGRATYSCRGPIERGESTTRCWGLTAWRVDQAVVEAFLQVAQPPELELALAVTREAERQAEEVDSQWRLRLERSRYNAKLAERRYKAVDPDKRNVAQTLESEWEQRLVDLAEVERGYEAARQARKVQLSDADRARVFELARDLPAVWRAPTTRDAQRKNLLRTLIVGVTLTPIDVPSRQTSLKILWEGGAITELVVQRPRFANGRQAAPEADQRILVHIDAGLNDAQIAEVLNAEGHVTGTERRWTWQSVRQVRRRLGIRRSMANKKPFPMRREDGLYSTRGVAQFFGVEDTTVLRWRKQGLLAVVEAGGPGRPAWYRLDDEVTHRIIENSYKARAHRKTVRTAAGGTS
jgi:DNA invertase Pin-like site-specific DNA recombinase